MKKVIVIKDYKGLRTGDIIVIGNNEAHSLIDGGYAVLEKFYIPKVDYQDKMMRTKYNKRSKQ